MIKLHISVVKWLDRFNILHSCWDDIWNTVFNFLSSNSTKTLIWQQLHLNFYTQYSYNKWHNQQLPCSLCCKIPQTIFHIILDCQFSTKIWAHLEPCLRELEPSGVSKEEMAFGILRKKPGIGVLMRNWVSYLLREFISEQERAAYHSGKAPKLGQAKHMFSTRVKLEVNKKLWRYQNDGDIGTFEKFFTYKNVLCKPDGNNGYETLNIFRRPLR